MPGKKILVVEDERIIANDIRQSLGELGYSVPAVASSGEEAIKYASEFAPDLVLMDIVLKGNIDGIKAAAHIRENFNIPVVYLTSHSDEATFRRAKETGPFGYLLKPFDDRELRNCIEMSIYGHDVESVLKESEKWLSITLMSIADGVIVADFEWRVEFMNPAAEKVTGWVVKDAIGSDLPVVFNAVFDETREPVRELLGKVLSEGVVVGAEKDMILVDRDGRDVPVEVNAAPVKDEGGEISGLVITFRDITERKKAEDERRKLISELEHLSKTDRLTGLLNRGAVIDRLNYEISRSLRYGSDLSIMLCDIDFFKDINDTYGHAAGDTALRLVSECLKHTVRDYDLVGRYGGDEFLILLPETTTEQGREVAERSRKAVEAVEFEAEPGVMARMTLSIGVSGFSGRDDNSDMLIKRADDAMYVSKREGRNRLTLV
jgi:diguanylate cyclase (GGDEF)-like protein/PAS domain S-box-containing protein